MSDHEWGSRHDGGGEGGGRRPEGEGRQRSNLAFVLSGHTDNGACTSDVVDTAGAGSWYWLETHRRADRQETDTDRHRQTAKLTDRQADGGRGGGRGREA